MTKRKNTILSDAQRTDIINKYSYRLLALQEANQYTIENLARQFSCAKNTVWGLVRHMEAQEGEDSYVKSLEKELQKVSEENIKLRRDNFMARSEKLKLVDRIKQVIGL